MPQPHRKRLTRYECPGHARSLAFSTYRRLPLLEEAAHAEIVLDAIGRACGKQGWSVLAYVVMPEHVHLLVLPAHGPRASPPSISRLLWAIKRPNSFRVKQRLDEVNAPLLDELTIRERPGTTVFRFWQEGGGYDRNITSLETLRHTIEYIHANPVRRGLVRRPEDYRWSSARQWLFPDDAVSEWMPRIECGAVG